MAPMTCLHLILHSAPLAPPNFPIIPTPMHIHIHDAHVHVLISLSPSSLDGPGTYTVVQCGAAGHNIRSKPNMKGCPLGRLSKGSIVNAVKEVHMYMYMHYM